MSDNHEYYFEVAELYATSSSCIRRHYGAVIVKDNNIVSFGVNDSPKGTEPCNKLGYCVRNKYNIPRGTRYELCRSVHAESNAILKASINDLDRSTLYLVGLESDGSYVEQSEPCIMCKRLIINSGIRRVLVRTSKSPLKYNTFYPKDWIDNDLTIECKDTYVKEEYIDNEES